MQAAICCTRGGLDATIPSNPKKRVVNGVWPCGATPLQQRTPFASTASHPRKKHFASRRHWDRRMRKSSVALLFDQLLGQWVSIRTPSATVSVYFPRTSNSTHGKRGPPYLRSYPQGIWLEMTNLPDDQRSHVTVISSSIRGRGGGYCLYPCSVDDKTLL